MGSRQDVFGSNQGSSALEFQFGTSSQPVTEIHQPWVAPDHRLLAVDNLSIGELGDSALAIGGENTTVRMVGKSAKRGCRRYAVNPGDLGTYLVASGDVSDDEGADVVVDDPFAITAASGQHTLGTENPPSTSAPHRMLACMRFGTSDGNGCRRLVSNCNMGEQVS